MKKLTFKIVPPIEDPCPECQGTGSKWPKRKDGGYDLRYTHPVGPCERCGGSGER